MASPAAGPQGVWPPPALRVTVPRLGAGDLATLRGSPLRAGPREDTPQRHALGDAEHEAIVAACALLRAQLVRSARTVHALVAPGSELPALDGALDELGWPRAGRR